MESEGEREVICVLPRQTVMRMRQQTGVIFLLFCLLLLLTNHRYFKQDSPMVQSRLEDVNQSTPVFSQLPHQHYRHHHHHHHHETIKLHELGHSRDLAVYSVFLDVRPSDNQTERRSINGHQNGVLRILVAKRPGSTPRLRCTFTNGQSIPTRDLRGNMFQFYELTEGHMKTYGGFMTFCDVLPLAELRKGVTITREADLPREQEKYVSLPVIHHEMSPGQPVSSQLHQDPMVFRHKFGHCLPALHHIHAINISQTREWFNVHIRLGVTIFRLYYAEPLTRDIENLFNEIRRRVVVQTFPISWPGNEDAVRRLSWYYLQTTTANDCLLRSLYDTRHVFFGDIDEVLVPRSDGLHNWEDLTKRLWTNPLIPGLCFSTFRYVRNSQYPSFKEAVFREAVADVIRKKCLVRPQSILEMGIHHISKPFEEASMSVTIPQEDMERHAHIHHYKNPDFSFTSSMGFIKDDSIRRFMD